MDVNGTRFQELLGRADLARCTLDAGIAVSDEATLRPLLFRLAAPEGAAPDDPAAARRGAGRDRYGNWYWVDESRARVRVQSSGTGTVSDFWPAPTPAEEPPADAFAPIEVAEPTPCRFGGLGVTEDHYLLVGTLDVPGLLVFDLHAGGPPRHLRWPAAVEFQPFDLAPAPGGGAWVLDRENRRTWALDRRLAVIHPPGPPPPPEDFTPAAGGTDDLRPPPAGFPQGLDLSAAASPVAAADPVAIEALPDGTVLILDRGRDPVVVHRYRFDQLLSTAALDLSGVLATAPAPGERLFGADLAFVQGANGASDRVYVPSADGNQGFAFAVTWEDALLALSPAGGGVSDAPFLPMRLFGGKGLVAAGGYAWYDVGELGWVPLVEQKRPRYVPEGTLETFPLDGRDPGCVWHRLFVDGCLPPQTTIEVWSRTADEERDLARAPWAREPDPRRRSGGAELPLLPPPGGNDARGVFELLFQRARGRFLQLRVRLRGDRRTSPRLRALRVWYPRFSYLERYLPAVYREDAESASFLDRFLANLEGLFTQVEDRMAVAQLLFDARTAPAEALDWLASWFGVALDPAWTEARRRLLLRHAMDFFRMRGTVRGLQTALRLVIDECPDDDLFSDEASPRPASIRFLEWFRLREAPALVFGDPSEQSGIRTVSAPPAWTPEEGGAALLERYRAAARAAGLTSPIAAFPVFEPGDGTAPLWRRFLRDVLALSRTAGPGEVGAWRDFLAARYATAAEYDEAWDTAVADVRAVDLPTSLPQDGTPLFDWYQFQLGGGRFVPSGTRWIPAQGGAVLGERWRQALHAAGLATDGAGFPVVEPAGDAAAAWRKFASDVLGFVPSSGAREQQAWRDFLARRYRRVAALNEAHGASYSGFDDPALRLPVSLPADGAPLRDWYQLFALAIASVRGAHRFTVLLPVPAREAFAVALQEERRKLARRIVQLEKPAHTLFDVKFYWAMFRIGEARLGADTLLDVGSRAPDLMPPVVLGQAALAQSRLAGTPQERDRERAVLGQHALRDRNSEEKRS